MTPDLVFLRAPENAVDACRVAVIHNGMEINIPLTAERLSIILEDGQKYMGRHIRNRGNG